MIQLLGKGAGHKAVAQVDHKLHRGHFQIRGAGGYDAKAGKLAGACKIGKGDKHRLETERPELTAMMPKVKDTAR